MNYMTARKLAKKKDTSLNIPVSVGILGNYTTHFFKDHIRNLLILSGYNPEIHEGAYDQTDIELLDPDSGIYKAKSEIIIILESALKIADKSYAMSTEAKATLADHFLEVIERRIQLINTHNPVAKIMMFTFELYDDNGFGNYFSKTDQSLLRQFYLLNSGLMELTAKYTGFFVLDIQKILFRNNPYRDASLLLSSDLPYTLETQFDMAKTATSFIGAMKGKLKKCLILDLDNTLWGGIIGDDGPENIQIGDLGIGKAYTRLQQWIKSLKERGIILAVCSKNDEQIAKEAFLKNHNMLLQLEDIAVFVANWNNKADNITHIQEVLNIGFDSMVFLDDNPAEREIVRQRHPNITVPELPADPAFYLPFLQQLDLFDIASYSEKDKDRTRQYQEEAERRSLQIKYSSIDDYLESLTMKGDISAFNSQDIPRIAQLTQRSNQYNLRTIRYTEQEITAIANSPGYITYTVKLSDKFGDYGLISVLVLKLVSPEEAFIDTWIMSCRVLKRGVEDFVLENISKDLKRLKIRYLSGEYIPTAKNKMVAELLLKVGLTPVEKGIFKGEIKDFVIQKHFIQ
ncbi:HAD-IIIC family phosphatase [Robertkochia solimangrovi]|uniref:HAD-IIIC family phosphatase n=1 Tax=Robertkochia solimangrovi TaxID=2213046 RepID=UPI0013A56934|nr:HAD-IIIC family phosphatase [Robertkochia solimangrovi]